MFVLKVGKNEGKMRSLVSTLGVVVSSHWMRNDAWEEEPQRKNREGEKKGNWLEGSRLRPMRTAWV